MHEIVEFEAGLCGSPSIHLLTASLVLTLNFATTFVSFQFAAGRPISTYTQSKHRY